MPKNVRIEGVGVVRFPDDMSDSDITHAIETDILSPRAAIANRADNPPPSRFGDPNPQDMGAGDIAGAVVKGLGHLTGVPTSSEELKRYAMDLIGNLATAGMYGGVKQTSNIINDVRDGYVPVVGRPIADVSKPARAVAAGRPPTKAENLQAIDSGTSLAGMAALQHPAVGAALGEAAGRMGREGGAIDAPASTQYADVLDPTGANRPLAETIGDQLRNKGVRMRNPRAELRDAFGGHGQQVLDEKSVQQFANPAAQDSQLAALQEKYPNAEITRQGDKFAVRQIVDQTHAGSVDQQGADILAPGAQVRSPIAKGQVGKAILGGAATGIATAVGGPIAGKIVGGLAGAADAISIARKIMTNPLWKTTSAVIKTDLAKALRSGDTATALDIGSKIIGGLALNDEYGHDQAVHDVVNSAYTQAGGDPQIARQILATKDVVYKNPDGTEVSPPHHVVVAFLNSLEQQR